MSHGRAHRDRITDEAGEWFARAQDPGFSDADKAALADWLAGSAEHVREYLSLAALVEEISQLEGTSIEGLVERSRRAGDEKNVVPMSGVRVAEEELGSLAREVEEEEMEDWSSGLSRAGELDQWDVGGELEQGDRRRSLTQERAAKGSLLQRARAPRRFWAAAASILLVIAAAATLYIQSTGPEVYATALGEQRSVRLVDGSVVTLNAQSTIAVAFSEERRDVRLLSGEVLFDVAKDPSRPFQVLMQGTVIRAIGTSFNVRHRDGDTTVTVVEGTVEVESMPTASSPGARVGRPDEAEPSTAPVRQVEVQPVRVTVGQQAKIEAKSGQVVVIDTNVSKATAWRERRLVFDAWPLSKVVAEFNLYNAQPFVIDDPELAQRAISGAFDADDRESFALFLEQAEIADAETRSDGTIELLRP